VLRQDQKKIQHVLSIDSILFVADKPEHQGNSLSSNQTVVEGRNAEFYCRTDAFPGVLDYRWFKDGIQIVNSADYTITSLSDGERLTIQQAKKSSAGQYSCDGRNELGTGKRKYASLLVNCK